MERFRVWRMAGGPDMRWAGALAAFLLLVVPAIASAAVERLTPAGAGLPVELVGSSPDGARVIFTTGAKLVPADEDTRLDVYESSAGAVTLLSLGPDGGNGAFDAVGKGMSKDGTHVFFETTEQLRSGDTDSRTDVYEHDATGVHLRTGIWAGGTGGVGNTVADDATFLKTTDDGSQLYFRTNEKLSDLDTGGGTSVYRRSPGPLVSGDLTYFESISSPYADALALSPDGGRLVFESGLPLGGDLDGSGPMDVFALNFVPPPGLQTPPALLSAGDLRTDATFESAVFRGASRQATNVVFDTPIPLVSADDDMQNDLYQYTETGTRLLTAPEAAFAGEAPRIAQFDAISETGATVLFDSAEKLTSGDDDKKLDVFVNVYSTVAGLGGLRRISFGPAVGGGGAINATGVGLSADGSHAYFETTERLSLSDDDGGANDVYEYDGATTRLVSTGPVGDAAADPSGSHFTGSSPDGVRVYFTSSAKLVEEDTDASVDLYVREAGVTTLLSLGSAGGNGAFDVQARGVSADGSRAFFRSTEGLTDATPGGWNLYATGVPPVTPPAPAPGPGPGPVPPPAPAAAPDTVKPKISLALVKGQKLKTVLKKGAIALRLGCDEACRLAVVLKLDGAAGAAVKRKPANLGSASERFAAKGSRVVKVKLTKRGRAALAKARRTARVRVSVTATDTAGNSSARSARLTLIR